MKKYISIIAAFLFTTILSGYTGEYLNNNLTFYNTENISSKGNSISKLISEKRSRGFFIETPLLVKSSKKTLNKLNEFVSNAAIYEINTEKVNTTYNNKPENISFTIDAPGIAGFELELTRVNIAPDNLKIQAVNESGNSYNNFKPGLTYWGIIKGDNNSIASLTVFENCVMGLISNDLGNFVLGPRKDENNRFSNDFIFYNDKDLLIKDNFKCDADDYSPLIERGISFRKSLNQHNWSMSPIPRDSIRIYFTADYQMYLDNGSSLQQTGLFVQNVFSNTSLIYARETDPIPVRLAQTISVFTSADPYRNLNDSYDILNLFGSNTQDNFSGDLAQLLSSGHSQQLGGIAWINVLCQPYHYYPPPDDAHYGRFSFSNIEPNFLPYPVYSWTVTVITHELGHNIASKHTHACVWPTSSGQIDSCYQSENGCVVGTVPNQNGTIMSYCHLNGAINLSRGFGNLPGDTIKLGYDLARCLDSALNSSEVPLVYNLLQNFPNPFNPGTNIKFALPASGYVTVRIYDLKGSEITTLLKNKFYEAGLFSIYFDAAVFKLASGVYFYRLDVNNGNNEAYSQIKKMVLVK